MSARQMIFNSMYTLYLLYMCSDNVYCSTVCKTNDLDLVYFVILDEQKYKNCYTKKVQIAYFVQS